MTARADEWKIGFFVLAVFSLPTTSLALLGGSAPPRNRIRAYHMNSVLGPTALRLEVTS